VTLTDFDYAGFAKSMATQAKDVIPEDIDPAGKAYITNLVFNYCNLAGEALANDPQSVLDTEQATIVCQFIGEWTFHKAIDVIRGNIPVEARDETLQKVAFTVFEIAKLALSKGMPLDDIISLVEEHVKRTYSEAVADLTNKGIINNDVAQSALSQSNIDVMTQNMQKEREEEMQRQAEQEQAERAAQEAAAAAQAQPSQGPNNKVFKLASLALVLKNFPQNKANSILKKINKKDADVIIKYMNMPDLQMRLDSKIAIQYLKEIKKNIPHDEGVDIVKIGRKIRTIVNNSSSERISGIIRNERANIKKIVYSKNNSDICSVPPKIASILYNYLEEKIRT